MNDGQVLRTLAGEPVVVYALIQRDGRPDLVEMHVDDALEKSELFPGSRIERCHLLPLPEDARTVQREGGADE
jgi:hypothetical protein